MLKMVAKTEINLEYDDLTLPERVSNFILLGLYCPVLVFLCHQFYVNRRLADKPWLVKQTFGVNILLIASIVLRYHISLTRMIYFSDAFAPYIFKDPNAHLIQVDIYLNISSLVFFCVSQFCILICQVW
jgi:hypothetical protein